MDNKLDDLEVKLNPVTLVEVLLALEVLLPQAVKVTQAVVDSLGVLSVSQVFKAPRKLIRPHGDLRYKLM